MKTDEQTNAPPPLAPLRAYNPDVLSCIANLSNDEVFTPPELANRMLDMLPQELFSDSSATFLDPACKSGVFLREIAKRLIKGLEREIPDLQTRLDHIFRKQLFGLAITELTGLLSRRSLYCSKFPNGKYSVVRFRDEQGNIRFGRVEHEWENGKCRFCGASQSQWDRGDALESHAYSFIHADNPEELFNMKFDVIISNPPYQIDDGGNSASASPIYDRFVLQAQKLNPKYLVMIIPARWYTGGKGLDKFRDSMLSDERISVLNDFVNSKDCFSGLSVSGGICYFLWDRNHRGECRFTTCNSGKISTAMRNLHEFPVFVRYNEAINVIHKVVHTKEKSLVEIITSRNPYGIPTNARGQSTNFKGAYKLISSEGEGYINQSDILSNQESANAFKVMITRIMREHAGEPDKTGQLGVLATIRLLRPKEVCTDTYITAGCFHSQEEAENLANYLRGKFARFLLLQAAASINLSRATYRFVPMQDFSKPWTDEELYRKYKLEPDEIAFIESMIKPME